MIFQKIWEDWSFPYPAHCILQDEKIRTDTFNSIQSVNLTFLEVWLLNLLREIEKKQAALQYGQSQDW